MKLDNQIAAIVTGAASGLGEATARALAERGVRVAVFDRDADKGQAVASSIGGIFAQVDVTSDEAVDAGLALAREAHGQERILVNCAGVATAAKTVGRDKETGKPKPYPIQQFELAIQINLIGTFRMIAKSAFGMVSLDPLEDGERGLIVNTASVAAQDGQIGQVAYSASKAGVLGMALPIARDLMGEGIRVNTILPGVFETPMVAMMPQNVKDALAAQVPFPKRLGRAEEYARLAVFMAENTYLNGEYVRLDGAIRMAPR
ncbi:SDR family NAD(P)-dependent oxidoreductase [Sphingosinicella rhizophila]|uniref:SDR family NAD(P)-dependent oxidoreductase n=1 Tax=Sphingosinicella rhizophila TaxID=3050082 RepID=A0ABU3QBM8_9SPHN|nr:SDR family NAD(P)-dependent oxidoreductase [Sphingosinicella sp. GR2756]MDT9600804.1 SDR family NAD(P)-dependent oxidoreductase [Sphingosinicella sp. GR2756]